MFCLNIRQFIHFITIRLKSELVTKKPELGLHRYPVHSSKLGKIVEIDNDIIAKIARVAGTPTDKGAGLYLTKKIHDSVKKGDLLYTVYAQSKFKLDLAKEFLRKNNGYRVN